MQGRSGRIIKRADPATIQDKFLVGYQGWFTCPGDGEPLEPGHHGWLHWFGAPIPDGGHPNTDLWPDVSEYAPDELFPATGLKYSNGEQAFLFSSRNAKTVQRHFHWMARHGVDGVFLQRFLGQCDLPGSEGMRRIRDEVGARVREAAEKEGRVFAIMYDVSGVPADRVLQVITRDWCHLVYEEHILDSPNYLREKRRPVVAVWGLGFEGRGHTPSLVRSVCDFLSSATPGGAYLFAGTPTHWRTGTGDAEHDPAFRDIWLNCFDAISPWTIGRFSNEDEADRFAEDVMRPDFDLIKKRNQEAEMKGEKKIDYIPVVFPGGSGFNMTEGKWALNGIKRNGGKFLWKQIFNARRQGARVMYGAMWDEYDEGTAFMPVVEKKRQLPQSEGNKFPFLALDADGLDIPSDWYMRICGFAAEGVRSERRIHESFPSKELQDYWSSRPRYEDVDNKSGDFISGSSSGPGDSSTPCSNANPEGSGSGSREGGQSYEEWLAGQKEKGDEPPPPPYTLEAEEEAPEPDAQRAAAAQAPEVPQPAPSSQLSSQQPLGQQEAATSHAPSYQSRVETYTNPNPCHLAGAPGARPLEATPSSSQPHQDPTASYVQPSTTSPCQPRVDAYMNPSASQLAGAPAAGPLEPAPSSSQQTHQDPAASYAQPSTTSPYQPRVDAYTNPGASQLAGAPANRPPEHRHDHQPPSSASPASPGANPTPTPSTNAQTGYPPPSSISNPGHPPYASDPVTGLANDFGRQHISSPGAVTSGGTTQTPAPPTAPRPPLHPSHPQAQSQYGGRPPSRPQTAQTHPPRPPSQQGRPPSQQGRPPFATNLSQSQSPPMPGGLPLGNANSAPGQPQWPPAEWNVQPTHQQPHHNQSQPSQQHGYPSYPNQSPSPPQTQSPPQTFSGTPHGGADLTRPHTFSARPNFTQNQQYGDAPLASPTSPLRPHASISAGSMRPPTVNSTRPSYGAGASTGYPPQQAADLSHQGGSTYPGQSASTYPGQNTPSSSYQAQLPSSTYPGQQAPSSSYPGQPSNPASTYPGQAPTPSAYPGQSSYPTAPGAPSFPSFSSGPSGRPHSPLSPSFPGSSAYNPSAGASSYGAPTGGFAFPEAAGTEVGFYNIPQPNVTAPGRPGYTPSYGPNASPPQGQSPYFASSGGFPQPNSGGQSPPLPGSHVKPVPPPMPPRPPTSPPHNSSTLGFPAAHTSGSGGSGPLGFAFNAVDRVAGRQTREQLENLAQSGTKFFSKFTR
ncbi:hypothetical protein HGRIS_014771 [Hohenbuehelia grisea]|uniref:Xylosidase/arabinosidase n=1 Tax=Hohenbuehelia grisea TaxID=104357 RepID=A0ABR3IQL8_9AGAR